MTEPKKSKPPKPSVLLVDDEPEILQSLIGLLRREFDLHTASSGKEALEILEQHPIQVVMTDQRMPEMTGVKLIKRVKTSHPEAIRIVFTGYADIKAVIDAINEAELYRYITKPWDPDELVEVLHEAAAEFARLAERRQLRHDLQDHLERGERLAEQLSAGEAAAPADLEQFRLTARQLLERLDKIDSI